MRCARTSHLAPVCDVRDCVFAIVVLRSRKLRAVNVDDEHCTMPAGPGGWRSRALRGNVHQPKKHVLEHFKYVCVCVSVCARVIVRSGVRSTVKPAILLAVLSVFDSRIK